ncbi:MAG: class I SAM-dependent methyltransferase [Gemmatimonadales bacterium]|nr:MAG: class I SAM-dependent methyltransferase [Gemmatimonadales bacterium]
MTGTGSRQSREWFRDWFGEEYLALYPHRDAAEAERAVELYLNTVPPTEGRVLDLASGAGRHIRELRQLGVQAIGLDLSAVLLREARNIDPILPIVRGDMRDLPFADSSFGGLTSFFTSFGYFETVEEDRLVIGQIRRTLSMGGTFMLDFFNARRVRAQLVPQDVRWFGGRRVTQTREIEGDMVVKRIVIDPADESEPVRGFEERVRLYEPAQLESMLCEQGLDTEYRFGDYGGNSFSADSERLILAGHAQ